MAKINLLPWRQELRKKHLNEFLGMIVGGIVVAGIVMATWHFHNENLIEHQKNRNNYLKREIAAVDQRIKEIEGIERKKNQLISKMNVITELQSSRPQIVRLMDELVTTLPEGVYLTGTKQSGGNIALDGKAQSNASVSSYMRNIEDTVWMDKPNLTIIQKKGRGSQDNVGFRDFKLSAVQAQPKKKKDEAQ